MWALISGLSIFFDILDKKQDESLTFRYKDAGILTAK